MGNIFLPTDPAQRARCKTIIEQAIEDAGQTLIGWRELPTNPDIADVGKVARAAMPTFEQLFVGKGAIGGMENESFERKLYAIRKHSAHLVRGDESVTQSHLFYMCSLSTNVIIYKGMLTPDQLFPFFADLLNPGYESHMAMVHSRFSTNTFPSWDRAQPSRFMSHNGEINTLLGNINAMNAREGTVASEYFGEDIKNLFPIVEPDCSDSGTFDNVLEFLLMSGRSLPEALLMMIPEAWQQHSGMSAEKKRFTNITHASLSLGTDPLPSHSPTDPASVLFWTGTACAHHATTLPTMIFASWRRKLALFPWILPRSSKKGGSSPGEFSLLISNRDE